MNRDLDLVAIPWTDDAVEPEQVAEAIRATIEGFTGWDTEPGKLREHGRRCWLIWFNGVDLPLGGGDCIDLSIMPRVPKARFKPGDQVRLWKPGHAEHGLKGIVDRVMSIEAYGGPEARGPHAYRPTEKGWYEGSDDHWTSWTSGPLPDAMVVSEQVYQEEKATSGLRRSWRG